jgi:hypothetical protein
MKTALLVILSAFIVANLIRDMRSKRRSQTLVLHGNGKVAIDEQTELYTHPHSRIGWFGCWLILIKTSNNLKDSHSSKLSNRVYIFEDQLSSRDYSRLCRHILKSKTTLT